MQDVMLIITVVAAAVIERWRGKIPLWYPAVALAAGLLSQGLFEHGALNFKSALFAAGIAVCFLLPFRLYNQVTYSEILLAASVGAIAGFPFILFAFFAMALTSGTLAVLRFIWFGGFIKHLGSFIIMVKNTFRKKENRQPVELSSRDYVSFTASLAVGTVWSWTIFFFNI